MTDTSTTALQELVLAAIDDISILLGTPTDELEPGSFTMMISNHLENIATAAELNERQGLQLLCESFQQALVSENPADRPEGIPAEELALKWLFSLSGFLETPGDATLMNSLLTAFNDEQAEILNDILLLELDSLSSQAPPAVSESQDHQDESTLNFDYNSAAYIDSDDDVKEDEEDEEFHPSSYNTIEIINMFSDEFIDVSRHMDNILSGLIIENYHQSKAQQSLVDYQELIDRVILTTETLQLKGLGEVCKFVKHNIVMLGGLASLDEQDFNNIKALLSGWNAPVINYLGNPNDDEVCIQLMKYLEDIHWPEPLLDAHAREVLLLLIEGLDDLDSNNSLNVRQHIASTEDVSLNISSDASEALIEAFFHEVPTLAVEFSAHIERLANGEHIQKNTESAQRLAHTIKGSANLIGAVGIASLTHHIEDILEYLTRNNTTPPAQLAGLLQESADTIEAMIESLQGLSEEPREAQQILQSVLDWANKIDQGNLDQGNLDQENINDTTEIKFSASQSETKAEPEPETIHSDNIEKTRAKIKSPTAGLGEVLHVPVTQVDEMFRLVGEMSIAMGQMQEQIKGLINEGESLNTHDMVVQQRRFDLENLIDIKNVSSKQRRLRTSRITETRFDPLEMDQYDEVHGAVHSYIESVADSRSIGQQLGLQSHKLDGLLAQQNQLYGELQQIIMSTRMVPVESIVARLQRSVRQASRATGKKVLLEITGTELNIDGDVLTQLTAPLMHMLRNAVDHGIESGELRLAADKPEQGLITLNFTQQGNQVVVDCIDDGRGLDYGLIRVTAEDKGLVLNGQPLSKNETARLILQPGFTTKDSATQISGRGVGMDVVNTTINALKGSLEIEDSEVNKGSHFTLRLPITLVTNHSILASVENELFAIPTSSLVQILTPGIGEFGTLGNELTYQFDKDVYPARYLSQMYNIRTPSDLADVTSCYTLLVRSDTGIIAVIVDDVVDSYDLVVKDTGRYVKSVKGVSGISVLGNGDVIPVLDLPEQLRNASQAQIHNTQGENIETAVSSHIPRVLIVDDSLSVRQSLSQLIEDAGFDAQLARDGIEAMDMIREQAPDIVLADMEMPRMNGLELTSALRSNDSTNELPVIMITSRSMQKHRDEAEKAGVNMYMTKPFAEDLLLSNIQSQIRSAS